MSTPRKIAACITCGETRKIVAAGMCSMCYRKIRPERKRSERNKAIFAKVSDIARRQCGIKNAIFSSMRLLQCTCAGRRKIAKENFKRYKGSFFPYMECLECRYAILIDRGLLPPDLNVKISGIEQLNAAPPAAQSAAKFLVRVLGNGPMRQAEVKLSADREGISYRTLERAKKLLGVQSVKEKGKFCGVWWWQMPGANAKNNI